MKKKNVNTLSPIVLFTYNRPRHTRQTIEALKNNQLALKSRLFIFQDAAKPGHEGEVNQVSQYLKTIEGFREINIIKRQTNLGLANNIIDGVSKIVNKYGKIIVLEDDIITSPNFLNFMNNALEFYEKDSSIMSISGFTYPFHLPANYPDDVFVFYRTSSWGWATWKKEWNMVDFKIDKNHAIFHEEKLKNELKRAGMDLYEMLLKQVEGKIDSWAIRFALSHISNKKLAVFPIKSLTKNIGHDNSGRHCGTSNFWEVELGSDFLPAITNVKLNKEIVKSLQSKLNESKSNNLRSKIRKVFKWISYQFRNPQ
jgi:hypothetical protein